MSDFAGADTPQDIRDCLCFWVISRLVDLVLE